MRELLVVGLMLGLFLSGCNGEGASPPERGSLVAPDRPATVAAVAPKQPAVRRAVLETNALVTNEENRDLIASIGTYASAEGFPIFKDHVYEKEALYDNTTCAAVDAKAMMVLYYHPQGNQRIRCRGTVLN